MSKKYPVGTTAVVDIEIAPWARGLTVLGASRTRIKGGDWVSGHGHVSGTDETADDLYTDFVYPKKRTVKVKLDEDAAKLLNLLLWKLSHEAPGSEGLQKLSRKINAAYGEPTDEELERVTWDSALWGAIVVKAK